MVIEPVHIAVDGTLIAAQVYQPESSAEQKPAVVMLAGLSGTMDSSLAPFAEAICKTGVMAVMFDYRHFGASEGEPRQLLSVPQQLRDAAAVLAYVRGRSDVNADQIGIWSSSFGGGLGVHTAVADGNIKALVAQCPHLDNWRSTALNLRKRNWFQNLRLMLLALWAYGMSLFGFKGPSVPITTPSGFSILASEESSQFHQLAGPLWRNELALQSILRGKLHLNHALSVARKLDVPTLIQVCDRDQTVSNVGINAFVSKAGTGVRTSHYDCGHFEIYLPPHVQPAAAEAAQFLANYLRS